jgi:2-polyprenyl-3-methyl-5-hydroxy-6-metoxy-1,4-benzoquinol methylase
MGRENQYWKDVYKNKIKFASKKNSSSIPWEIKTVDPNLKQLLESSNLTSGKLLELGCGSGYDSAYLSIRGFNVTAIDVSEDIIELSKKLHKDSKVNFMTADFFQDIISEQFDIIYDRGFLHNYKTRLSEIFEKLNALLSKTGKLIIITGSPCQPIIESCMPPPIFLGEIEHYSSKYFKIIMAKEIPFVTNSDYENCLGYMFVLEKIDTNINYNR